MTDSSTRAAPDGWGLTEPDVLRLNHEVTTFRRLRRELDDVLLGTPANVADIRAEVVESWVSRRALVAPVPSYPAPGHVVGEIAATFDSLGRGETALDELLRNAIEDVEDRPVEAQQRSGFDVTKRTESMYGKPSVSLIDQARLAVETLEPDPTEDKTISAAEAAAAVQQELDRVAPGWSAVEREDMHATMSVSSLRRRVSIRSGAHFSVQTVNRLLVHEVHTHVLRSVNGETQPLNALSIAFGPNAPTEEGLAIFNERRFGCLQASAVRKYALRVLAADLALREGFREVFRMLVDYMPAEEAVDVALRSKRGMSDLDEPGAHLKDISYLSGWLEMESRAMSDPDLTDDLYLCKQPIELLPAMRYLRDLGWLQPRPGACPEVQVGEEVTASDELLALLSTD